VTWLWIALAVATVGGAALVLFKLAKVLTAARELQRNVNTLSEQVSAELHRLGGEYSKLGDNLDETRRK
jgi:hypothetical protein